MENYLYFAEADVETGGDGSSEAITVPASSYLFADPVAAGSTAFYFKSILGSDYGMQKVVLAHANNKNKEVIRGVLACINAHPSKGGFVVVANANAAALTIGTEFNQVFNGDVTGVTISEDTTGSFGSNVTGVAGGSTTYNSYGVGAVSTEVAPQYRREVQGDEIITEILVDLTGLAQKGDAANDAIGLAAGGNAYIGRYIQAETGTLYKAEVICLEVPGEGTSTISTDIDVAFNSSGAIAYDGAVGAAEINTGGFAALGSTGIIGFTATANDYIYLVEGDSSANTGVFNAGKLVVRLYGTTISF